MGLLAFRELDNFFNGSPGSGSNGIAPVYLLYGDEFLYKSALEKLIDHLLPGSLQRHNCERLEGTPDNVGEAVSRLNTYALLSDRKVVVLTDASLFHARGSETQIAAKIKDAAGRQRMDQAGRMLASMLGLMNLDYSALDDDRTREDLFGSQRDGWQWLLDILDYCRERQIPISQGESGADLLQTALVKGFAPQNHLIITAAVVDRRKSLFQTIKETGWVIDCSIPQGNRKADRAAREAVLKERAAGVLKRFGKRIEPAALRAVFDKTGFNLRTLAHNIEKLSDFAGDRDTITVADVDAVLQRTRTDPIFELTNAVTDRAPHRAIAYATSLLAGGEIDHPLQLLAAVANQVRKLILIKDFTDGPGGSVWQPAMPYPDFVRNVMPAIQHHDAAFLDRMQSWTELLDGPDRRASKNAKSTRKAAQKRPRQTDLMIAKSPQNAYPVYLLMQKSAKFSREDLRSAFEILSTADRAMKRGGHAPVMILEKAILDICR